MKHDLERSRCRPRKGQRIRAGGRDYVLLGSLGDGAVGLVRKATDRKTGRVVAVKFLAPDPKYIEVSAFDDVARRFRREGLRGAGLSHENLVRIIAYEDNEDGNCFESRKIKNPLIVMEYVRGGSLESLIKRVERSGSRNSNITEQTLSVAARVCRALCYLHERKITHRDVKPANIFLSSTAVGSQPAVVKLGDFGVTKWGDFLAAAASGTLTASHQRGLGTFKYMSPEQAIRPKDVTVRSDMFPLGITLFELFTGRILPSPHHVFEIMSVRRNRDSITGKLFALGLRCPPVEEDIFNLVLDMFLNRPKSRPTSANAGAFIEFYLERMFEIGENDL